MDIQAQVAARRAELARLEQQARAEQKAADQERKATEQQQLRDDLDTIAKELSTNDYQVRREEDHLAIAKPHEVRTRIPDDLKADHMKKLLNREARKLWTVGDNWLVISCISGGVCLLAAGGIGLILLFAGLSRRGMIMTKYRNRLRASYPDLSKAFLNHQPFLGEP